MREGYIIYVTGEEPPRKGELERVIRENHLDLFEYRVCGSAATLPGIYSAYGELRASTVSVISCLSVSYDRKQANYTFLEQNLNLDPVADLSRFCSPRELGD